MNPAQREALAGELKEEYARLRAENGQKESPVVSLEEAREQGAIAFFDSKYGEMVKVYTIGDVSKEVCGGPHVTHTGDMGHFRILKEQSSSAGVRRIKAVLEK